MVSLVLFIVVVVLSSADAQCATNGTFSKDLGPGHTYSIYTKSLYAKYEGPKDCLWLTTCPDGNIVFIDCPETEIPETYHCDGDRVVIKQGPGYISKRYCGARPITTVSAGPEMSVGLFVPPDSIGGRFFCQITCIPKFIVHFIK